MLSTQNYFRDVRIIFRRFKKIWIKINSWAWPRLNNENRFMKWTDYWNVSYSIYHALFFRWIIIWHIINWWIFSIHDRECVNCCNHARCKHKSCERFKKSYMSFELIEYLLIHDRRNQRQNFYQIFLHMCLRDLSLLYIKHCFFNCFHFERERDLRKIFIKKLFNCK